MIFNYKNFSEKAAQMRAVAVATALNKPFRDKIKKIANELGYQDIYKNALPFTRKLLADYVYTEDPHIELYQWPGFFLDAKIGDCDDIVIFLMSLFQVLSIPNEMIFMISETGPSHVYIIADFHGTNYIIDYATGAAPILKPTALAVPREFNRQLTLAALN